MTNENKLYERYLNKKGKLESEKSYKTFHEIYVPTNPTPTYKQLAKLSGHAESTCKEWITINNYRKRKQQIIEHQKQEEEQIVKKTIQTILPALAKLDEIELELHQQALQDKVDRIKKITNMSTTNPERIQLIREEQEAPKTTLKFKESLHVTQGLDDYIKQASQNTTVYNELLEKIEQQQNQQSLQTTQQLEEEYKDDKY